MKKLSAKQIETELSRAVESYSRGDPNSALAKIDSILRSNPESVAALMGKGSLLVALNRPPDALTTYLQVLKFEPSNAEALGWATQLSLGLRMPEQTERLARRLIKVQPQNDRAHFLLSIAMSFTGRWLEALEAIETALILQPQSLDYIVGRAQTLVKLHLHSLAIECYEKALASQPAPQIAYELAAVLLEEGKVPEAQELLERFAIQSPPEQRPHALLARAYTESQRFEDAEPHWVAATQHSSGNGVDLIKARAKSEIFSGRIRVAEVLLREGLEQGELLDQFFGMLAPITKLTDKDLSLIQRMEKLQGSGELDSYARQGLCFALGKSFNDLGDYEKAMAFYDSANHLRAEISPNKLKFDRDIWRGNIDFQIKNFDKKTVAEWSKGGLDSTKPLLVMGMIRSGTTLCEQILSCHSRIQGVGEQTFWLDHGGEALDRTSDQYSAEARLRLGKQYLKILDSHGSRAQYFIDKNPLNVLQGISLLCLYPNAKFIHMKRHAVDNLLSIWMTPMMTGLQFIATKEDLVYAYRQYLRLANHMRDVLPSENFQTFEYEDLTSFSVETTKCMLHYVGLESEAACFQPEKNPRTVRTPSVYQVRQPINTDSQAKWKLYSPWLGAFADLLEPTDA